MVERDRGGEADEALQDAFSEAGEGAGAVAFEGEDVFAGPEDAFDALADRCQVRPLAGFVAARGTHDGGVQFADRAREVASGVALVGEQDLTALALAARQQLERDVALIRLRRGELKRPRGAVGGQMGCSRKPQK